MSARQMGQPECMSLTVRTQLLNTEEMTGVCHEVLITLFVALFMAARFKCVWCHSRLQLPRNSLWQPRMRLKVGDWIASSNWSCTFGPLLSFLHCPPLSFVPSFSGLALPTPVIWSVCVRSCIVTPAIWSVVSRSWNVRSDIFSAPNLTRVSISVRKVLST